VVSSRPAALYHPLPYGRRSAPSKKDGGTLEGMTRNYSTPARDGTVTSGQWERSLPSSALCDHPGHCTTTPDAVEHAAMGHRHASHFALYGLTAMSPRIPTRTALERATSTAPPSKLLLETHKTRHDATPEARFARTTVYSVALYAMPLHVGKIVWHTCKLLLPWPIKGEAVPQPRGTMDSNRTYAFRLHHDIGTCLNQYLWDLEARPPLPPRL
jgi:hypothetical protein